jgi:hypothetical protein
MKTFNFAKARFLLPRMAAVAFGAILLGACNVSGFTDDNIAEGMRCSPAASHNECASGLVCTTASAADGTAFPGQSAGPVIPFCPENYCCSVDNNGNINSTNPNCQPGCAGGAAVECTASGSTTSPACACANAADPTTDPACQPPH